MALGQPAFGRVVCVVVEHHGLLATKAVGPDAGLADRVMRVVPGGAALERPGGPGHELQRLLVVVDEVQEADRAARERLGQLQAARQEFPFRQCSAELVDLQQRLRALFGVVALAHIAHRRDQQFAPGDVDRSGEDLDLAYFAAAQAVTEIEMRLSFLPHQFQFAPELIGAERIDVGDVHRPQCGLVPTVELGGSDVGIDDASIGRIDQQLGHAAIGKQRAVPGFALEQRLLRLLAPRLLLEGVERIADVRRHLQQQALHLGVEGVHGVGVQAQRADRDAAAVQRDRGRSRPAARGVTFAPGQRRRVLRHILAPDRSVFADRGSGGPATHRVVRVHRDLQRRQIPLEIAEAGHRNDPARGRFDPAHPGRLHAADVDDGAADRLEQLLPAGAADDRLVALDQRLVHLCQARQLAPFVEDLGWVRHGWCRGWR